MEKSYEEWKNEVNNWIDKISGGMGVIADDLADFDLQSRYEDGYPAKDAAVEALEFDTPYMNWYELAEDL